MHNSTVDFSNPQITQRLHKLAVADGRKLRECGITNPTEHLLLEMGKKRLREVLIDFGYDPSLVDKYCK